MSSKEDFTYKVLLKLLSLYKVMGVTLVIVAFTIVILNFSPEILYGLDPDAIELEKNLLVQTVSVQTPKTEPNVDPDPIVINKLPNKDLGLPLASTLQIPVIGVNGVIHEGENGNKELEKGIWLDGSFGAPDSDYPVVLASHRFGYSSWSKDFRTKNSFYSLPKVKTGDEVVLIWNQMKFKYKVTEVFETTTRFEASSDLILYTCMYFRSDKRFVVLAQRIYDNQ